MAARSDAMTIAKWFIAWAQADEADLSNLKLQKLLYYAQGHHLALYGEPLFDDEIYAWSHGPVVPAVWRAFREFGSSDVTIDPDDFEWDEVDPDTTEFLIDVWENYGGFGAWRLRTMTHSEPPWRDSFERDVLNIAIPKDALHRYFSRLGQSA